MRDRRKLFPRLRAPEEVLEEVKARLPRGIREIIVDLYEAVWHIAAEDVAARVSYPPEPRATADGYAVRHTCVAGAHEAAPVRLPVVERVRVGEVPSKRIEGCEAVEVDTGAPIPSGADAVVPVEYTREVAGVVEIYKSVGFGENVAWPGSDIVEGEVVVRRGQLLYPQLVGALAATGVDSIRVYDKPRVCIAATGVELVKPGEQLPPGHVYEVNTYVIRGFLEKDGFPSKVLGILPDDEEQVARALHNCLRDHDVMLFTGGTSAGPYDVVYRVLEAEGELVAHGLKLKPGKPTAVAIVRDKLVIGLPGNPVSALNVFRVLVRPLLWHLAGGEPPSPEGVLRAKLLVSAPGARGRRLYQPVVLLESSGVPYAIPIEFESYMIVTYSRSDGYIIVPEDVHEVMPEDAEVEVHLHTGTWRATMYCAGEETGDEHRLGCKWLGGGTALAAKILEKHATKAVLTMSPLHPAFSEPRAGRVERVTRDVAIVGSPKPNVIAMPPPSTSLRQILVEHIESFKHAIPARSSRMAALLVAKGYADAGVTLLKHAEEFHLRVIDVVKEELIRVYLEPQAMR
ncbi:molybdenum cofactor synthesis domain protein [Pyrolobus fumarii 1A]|uniref:Molybdenum cofactor synthesis domain protein n=1 Tax=Pyrolobus fumarii (strain DSM 11204 / 1A) TaxID=694429 RepID=G0EHI8_PYRF1|nr:gephyrin-like molybdotransferase Glp [Pyrolobus fumarii]AEM39341.1 molybdenum cofactor synthesis domain protein [Pyrolobus fumarii 1A]